MEHQPTYRNNLFKSCNMIKYIIYTVEHPELCLVILFAEDFNDYAIYGTITIRERTFIISKQNYSIFCPNINLFASCWTSYRKIWEYG